ncbi:cytochrome C [Marichromatium purpuratum 984]|uniref:Cytochrome C n=1 Tax=Marichromatium purpuratum 984 TaxID=765910 RepID=W0E7I7_MARPU|nr:Dihem cytochrome c [Marichromatium purpuratum]AHF05036.1 cytochrome C [Marichromatium purpuratum 984]
MPLRIIPRFALLALTLTSTAQADDDRLGAVTDPTTRAVCGDCHLVYQPALLSARDWRQIMTPQSLAAHYGETLELDETRRLAISDYLQANATVSARLDPPPTSGLPRITETTAFRHEHAELARLQRNAGQSLPTLGDCLGCHPRAESGIYEDDEVHIPGFGHWRD